MPNQNVSPFWKLLSQSVITQSVLTVLIWTTICILFIMGHEVPTILMGAGLTILGFFFGAKTQRVNLDNNPVIVASSAPTVQKEE